MKENDRSRMAFGLAKEEKQGFVERLEGVLEGLEEKASHKSL